MRLPVCTYLQGSVLLNEFELLSSVISYPKNNNLFKNSIIDKKKRSKC